MTKNDDIVFGETALSRLFSIGWRPSAKPDFLHFAGNSDGGAWGSTRTIPVTVHLIRWRDPSHAVAVVEAN